MRILAKIKYCPSCGFYRGGEEHQLTPTIKRDLDHCPKCGQALEEEIHSIWTAREKEPHE